MYGLANGRGHSQILESLQGIGMISGAAWVKTSTIQSKLDRFAFLVWREVVAVDGVASVDLQ